MHYCRFCPFKSKYNWVVERHTESKHIVEPNKRVFLCGNCELITSSVEEMIKHKKDEHNIIWNGGNEVKDKEKEKGDGGEGGEEGEDDGGEGEGGDDDGGEERGCEGGGDVIKNRAWNRSNFME